MPDWKGKGKPEYMAVSASQQYKQAGNSIVVDVLAHIYEQLFYPTPKPRKQQQLTLFDDLDDSLPAMPPTAANSDKEKIFLTTFSGYDSQLMAADVLKERHSDFRWTCKGWSDSTIRLSDAQPRISAVCRLCPWRHHHDRLARRETLAPGTRG